MTVLVGSANLLLLFAPEGYPKGSAIEATLVLGNLGSAPLWLNRRLLVGSPQGARFSREVWLDFRGPDGRNLDPRDSKRWPVAADSDYGLIAAGDELRMKMDLAQLFNLALPGRYLLRANYADGNERPPAPPTGATPLRAHLQTGKLQLLVLP